MNLKSSFRFSAPCYISRRGAESAEFKRASPIRCVFIFTNWVKIDLRISLHEFFIFCGFTKNSAISASLRLCVRLFNRGFYDEIKILKTRNLVCKSCKSCLKYRYPTACASYGNVNKNKSRKLPTIIYQLYRQDLSREAREV